MKPPNAGSFSPAGAARTGPVAATRPTIAVTATVLLMVLLFFGFIHAWRSDSHVVVAPDDSAITPSLGADLYALLARGFLKGQLSLDAQPPAELIEAENPYDPATRPRVLYPHDTSLYRGKFYIYFGPSPAVLLFVPYRWLTGHDMASHFATFVFVCAAYAGLLALFSRIRRDYFPEAKAWAVVAGAVALGGASMFLPLLRRPAVYEVAISCGVAAAVWGMYCAYRSRDAARPLLWAAACGALLGIAVGARPTLGLLSLPALMLMDRGRAEGWLARLRNGRVWAAAGAGACFVVGLLAYNQARFGDPLEFGQKYQLSGQNEGAIDHFGRRFVPTQSYLYLLAPLGPAPSFPFVTQAKASDVPPGFGAHEFSFGLLTNLPILWFAAIALFVAARSHAASGVMRAIAVGFVVTITPLLFFFGSCIRYQAEFAPMLALLAACGLLVAGSSQRMSARRWAGPVLVGVASLAPLVTALACVDMYNPAPNRPPSAFDTIGYWLNRPFVALRSMRLGSEGAVEIKFVPGVAQRAETLLRTHGPDGNAEMLSIERLNDAQARLVVRRVGQDAFMFPVEIDLAADREHVLRVNLSSLYPPRAVEMTKRTRREDFRVFKRWLQVEWNGKRVLEEPVPETEWRAAAVEIAPEFSGRVVSVERVTPHAPQNGRQVGGVALRIQFTFHHVGRSFPLAVTGYRGRGNFLFVQVVSGNEIRFGYDHWGKPQIWSPIVPVTYDEHRLEFWMPPIVTPDDPSPLIVKVDGREVWRAAVPFYRIEGPEAFIVRNPLGGSSCEAAFPGAVVEATGLR